jgi:hypothetical protein
MSIREDQLIENGKQIIAARRDVWDLERRGRSRSTFYDEELKIARRRYRELLAARKTLVNQAQTRAFE